jgi:hypothetical protein
MRYENKADATAGIVSGCLSVGGSIATLTDFTDLATTFMRFTITRANITVLPFANVGILSPLALGYFNDGTSVSSPGTYVAVLADE